MLTPSQHDTVTVCVDHICGGTVVNVNGVTVTPGGTGPRYVIRFAEVSPFPAQQVSLKSGRTATCCERYIPQQLMVTVTKGEDPDCIMVAGETVVPAGTGPR